MGYRAEQEVDDIFSRLDKCTFLTNGQTDRQTDGRTPDDSKDHAYAWRRAGKN